MTLTAESCISGHLRRSLAAGDVTAHTCNSHPILRCFLTPGVKTGRHLFRSGELVGHLHIKTYRSSRHAANQDIAPGLHPDWRRELVSDPGLAKGPRCRPGLKRRSLRHHGDGSRWRSRSRCPGPSSGSNWFRAAATGAAPAGNGGFWLQRDPQPPVDQTADETGR